MLFPQFRHLKQVPLLIVICPQVLHAGASLCILFAAALIESRLVAAVPFEALVALGSVDAGLPEAAATIRISLNAGPLLSYSSVVGISSHSSVPVFNISGLSST